MYGTFPHGQVNNKKKEAQLIQQVSEAIARYDAKSHSFNLSVVAAAAATTAAAAAARVTNPQPKAAASLEGSAWKPRQVPAVARLAEDQKFALYCKGFDRLSAARDRMRQWGILSPNLSEEDTYLCLYDGLGINEVSDRTDMQTVGELMGMRSAPAEDIQVDFDVVLAEFGRYQRAPYN